MLQINLVDFHENFKILKKIGEGNYAHVKHYHFIIIKVYLG